MLTIDRIENAVVRRIKAVLPKIHVEAYPANLRLFLEQFRHVNGAVLVQYTGRKRDYLADTRGTQKISIEVSVIAKNLREHQGIYPLLDAVFLAISGVQLMEEYDTGDPDNPKAERILGIQFFQEDESFETYLDKYGIWVYTQEYKSKKIPFLTPEVETDVLIRSMELLVNNKTELTIPEEE